jgi:hypothetical protein
MFDGPFRTERLRSHMELTEETGARGLVVQVLRER